MLGTSNSQAAKLTGGSMNKNISQANLPNVKLTVNSFSLSRGNMNITGEVSNVAHSGTVEMQANGAFSMIAGSDPSHGVSGGRSGGFNFQASRSWTGTTSSASPQTNSLGSGQALDITPSYYTAHMWLRTS